VSLRIPCISLVALFVAVGDIAATVVQLPVTNMFTLQHLISFLVQVVSNSSNRITVEHVAIIFGPILFRLPEGNPFWCSSLPQTLGIVVSMIKNYTHIFGVRFTAHTLASQW
jgi:hypothetical protein